MFQARYVQYPQVELTNVTRERCHFTLKNCDVSFANALRRVMLAEVPTLAIDLVTIEENSGALQDEMIAHRLGLLPIDSTEIRRYVNKNECKCSESCGKCSAKYTLNVECPPDGRYTVTHLDIIAHANSPPLVPREEDIVSPVASLQPRDLGLIIAKLSKNQAIKAELLAFKGIGKIHAKWSPCSTATFRYLPKIVINEELQRVVPTALKKKIVESCRRGLFNLIPVTRDANDDIGADGDFYVFGNNSITAAPEENYNLVVGDASLCVFDKDHEEVLSVDPAYKNFITITHVTDTFLFDVESTGAMPALQIVKMGLEVLLQKLEDLSDKFVSLPQVSQAVSGFGTAGGRLGAMGPTSSALDLS